ncbi:MAG: DUF1203 domain-containing protein [Nocardioidaceae bacterium]|nr:DUF1203 domain-containing protein [Nocardioidaceae bacterium]
MTTRTVTKIHASAIDPKRLDQIRASGEDEHGNPLSPFRASGQGEPLRCCLRYADPGEPIMLVSYAHFSMPSVWREVGPVYVHARKCDGYTAPDRFPVDFRTGPVLLRTYDARLSMDYEHLRIVPDGGDVESAVRELLVIERVHQVHVRPVKSQCFLFAVTRG